MTTAHALQTPSTHATSAAWTLLPSSPPCKARSQSSLEASASARSGPLRRGQEPLGQAYGSNPRRPTARQREGIAPRANVAFLPVAT